MGAQGWSVGRRVPLSPCRRDLGEGTVLSPENFGHFKPKNGAFWCILMHYVQVAVV